MNRHARYFPSLDEFRAIVARGGEIVPVYRQLLADRLTPVSAFEVLGRDAHAFLLESVVGGEQVARFSFIATSPSLVYQVTGGKAAVAQPVTHRMPTGPTAPYQTKDPLVDL